STAAVSLLRAVCHNAIWCSSILCAFVWCLYWLTVRSQSVSRQHAAIQHREDGTVYIYDLGSTHGTFVGKIRLQPNKYYILRLGDMVRFGASTRFFVLRGPDEAQEAEQQRLVQRKRDKEERRMHQEQIEEKQEEECSW